MIKIGQKYTQNIIYLLSVFIFTVLYFCIYYWGWLPAMFTDRGMFFSNFVLLFELSLKNVWVWLLPAVIMDKFLKRKIFYSVGLNIDRFAIRDILCGIVTALLGLAVIFSFVYFITNNAVIYLNFDNSQPWIIHNLWTVNDASVEELIFRGFIFQSIYRKSNSIVAILVGALLFAGAHFLYIGWHFVLFCNVFLAGVLFCQMYAITKSLWSSVAFHAIWNVTIFNVKIDNGNIEFEYVTIIVLILLILLVSFIYKPSYKINKYFLLHA